MKEIVKTPTLEKHLLNLVLTNIPNTRASVLPTITDHKQVTTGLNLKTPEKANITRVVWQFVKADLDKMRDMLNVKPLENMQRMHANDAAVFFNTAI